MGFLGGYEGMLNPVQHRLLDYREMDSLLFRGGTILGTSNRGRFSAKVGHGEVRRVPEEILEEAYTNFKELGLRALVCIGGDGSLTIAQQLFEIGMPVVGIPKTIDNDLDATIMTFGFETAVNCAVDALDRLHTTAESHDRVMVLEVMGRYAGWIATAAGLAGGADVILIPEIPFDYPSIVARIEERESYDKHFTIVIVAEGAREREGDYTASEEDETGEARLGGIGHVVAKEIQARTGKETRAVVLGHLQRGGSPSAWDRQLCTRFGVSAVEQIANENYGVMVALTPSGIAPVELVDAVDKIRTVPPDGEIVRVGRALGISFGSE
jgi:6-phosphofructokinase 1